MKKLILFDFDGVLFNSKNMKLSWQEVMKNFYKEKFNQYEKHIKDYHSKK